MTVAEQFDFDFENQKARLECELRERWAANEAASAKEWTTERFASVWYLGTDNQDLWRSLASWERNQIVNWYQLEQDRADHLNLRQIRPYAEVYKKEIAPFIPSKELMDDLENRAEAMADQLHKDWQLKREPSVYTYDPVLAGMVSLRLGRSICAIEPREFDSQGHPIGPIKERKLI